MITKAAPSLKFAATDLFASATDSDAAAFRLPPLTVFLLALLAAVSFKFFLAIQIGPETYQAAIAMMAEGSLAEQLAAKVLMLDGLSQAILTRL